MTSTSCLPLLFAALSSLPDASAPGRGFTPAVVVAAAAAVLAVLGLQARGQLRRDREELASSARKYAQASSKSKSALQSQLEASRAAQKTAEFALASQKKKNFQQLALLQAAQDEAASAQRRADAAIEAAQRAERQAAMARQQQQQIPRPPEGRSSTAQPPAAAAIAPSVVVEAAPAAEVLRLTEELAQARMQAAEAAEVAQLRATKERELKQELAALRHSQGRKDKRIEDLRRLDLMSRGKIEVLEDKLKRLGRELYENISALAQLRGEVGPVPRKRRPAPAPTATSDDLPARPEGAAAPTPADRGPSRAQQVPAAPQRRPQAAAASHTTQAPNGAAPQA